MPLLPVLWAAAAIALWCASVQAQSSSSSGTSWTESVASPFKQGFDKLGKALTPPKNASTTVVPGPEDDAVSLKGKGKPGPELYVAIARLYEQSGKLAEAEQQYQLALKQRPNDLPALLGYARLKDYRGQTKEAVQLYQRAVKLHPQQASAHNHLGLCYARQNQLAEAVEALNRAVQLEPGNPLYRNNIATVLVDQGRLREAIGQLQAVHSEAAAHYNVGYLLNKKGQPEAALQHFTLAMRADPSMEAARRWVNYLQKGQTQARLPQHPVANGVRVLSMPPTPAEQVVAAPGGPAPWRLPSTAQSSTANTHQPDVFGQGAAVPTAPLPPQSGSSAMRPLPRVQ